ncbi:MAG: glycohydrolase toxin TNT-related protein [Planctomyces sp.]|nr:glycohydrolase toxin TNT-related protein [Planctomyces sp.]
MVGLRKLDPPYKTAGQRLTSYYPPNRGFSGAPVAETLQPGTLIDRFGLDTGRFASPAGTPVPMRSLPYGAAEGHSAPSASSSRSRFKAGVQPRGLGSLEAVSSTSCRRACNRC